MNLSSATFALTLQLALLRRTILAQTCDGVSGPFVLEDLTGDCTYDKILEEYTRQIFDATGSTCAAGSALTAKQDLDAKLVAATSAPTGEDAGAMICKAMYDNAKQTPFSNAADKGTDMHFEQMFYNGRGDWQEEVETLYESDDGTATSVLQEDANKINEFYRGDAEYSRVTWPNGLTNFDDSTCSSHAAMCCWPKDRQANDNNGNCATPYDQNCVDKDVADNTNLCFADLGTGNRSSGFDSDNGFMVFPEDNNDGEGAIHCHGFAWADDEYDTISRYKANNLFFVSMYDHMTQRGYVEEIPGMPMCGCMEQMPVATRSDCTQVDVTEDWTVTYDGATFVGDLTKVEVDFNACRGRNNRNNDLWAYAARLYDEERMTRHQFGAVGRVLTNDHDCYTAVEYEKSKNGYVVGYDHDETMYTKVAARDDMKTAEPHGREAFNKALFEQSLTAPTTLEVAEFPNGETPIIYRICPDCVSTHRKIWYRRRTPIADPNFDLLHHLQYYRYHTPHPDNVWGEDFSLHSSYEDAVNDVDPWGCPNDAFNYWAPFTGECSPSGANEPAQYTIFSWTPGPRPNVAYYVNKPEDVGVRDYVDNDSITRASGLTDIDIGNVGLAGNTLEDNGVFHITGSGEDIWSYSDEFHYKSQPWSGDVDVRVHIADLANNGGHDWAKAGIMLRSDESPDATYAFQLTAGWGAVCAQHRRSKGAHAGSSGSCVGDSFANPWMRIVKKMEKVQFYYSATGLDGDWTLNAEDTFYFPEDTYRVGLAVTSNRNDYLAEATFDNYSIENYMFPTSAPSLSSAPSMWEPHVDVGSPAYPGQITTSPDQTIDYVKGAGGRLWGTSDSFYYVNDLVTDSADMMSYELFINRFDFHAHGARAGLMIRDTNDPDAANVFVGAGGYDMGAVFQSRPVAGAETVHHKAVYVNNINQFYVKLDKVGSVYTAYYKVLEGDAWIELGSTSMTATSTTVQVGRAVTAGPNYVYHATMETGSGVQSSTSG